MSSKALRRLETDATTRKRAQFEIFETTLTDDGNIRIRNASYADPADHEYVVTVTDGVPIECSCPADEHQAGACKHRAHIAMNDVLLTAVQRLDGSDDDVDDGEGRPADCQCADFLADHDLPCWPCYRDGYESPATDDE